MRKLGVLLPIYFTTPISSSIAEPLLMALPIVDGGSDSFRVAQLFDDEIAAPCDTKITLLEMTSQREKEFLLSGEIDGTFARVEEYRIKALRLIRVPEPTSTFPIYAYAVKKDMVIDGWDSIQNYTVAYMEDANYVESKLTTKDEYTFTFTHMMPALKFVAAGRADMFINSPFGVESLLKKDEMKDSGIKALLPAIGFYHIYMHVLSKHIKFATCFSRALKNIKADSSYEEIMGGEL